MSTSSVSPADYGFGVRQFGMWDTVVKTSKSFVLGGSNTHEHITNWRTNGAVLASCTCNN